MDSLGGAEASLFPLEPGEGTTRASHPCLPIQIGGVHKPAEAIFGLYPPAAHGGRLQKSSHEKLGDWMKEGDRGVFLGVKIYHGRLEVIALHAKIPAVTFEGFKQPARSRTQGTAYSAFLFPPQHWNRQQWHRQEFQSLFFLSGSFSSPGFCCF